MTFIHRLKRLAGPCVFIAALGTTEPASAEAVLYHEAPATYTSADALLRSAVTVADRVWADHGTPAHCAAMIYVYDETDDDIAARATIGGCKVWFVRAYRNAVWSTVNNASYTRASRRDVLAKLCGAATHERGHNLGLDHDAGWIMASPPTVTPTQCVAWAYAILPDRANRDKRRRRH
jgi:hypothetical protein